MQSQAHGHRSRLGAGMVASLLSVLCLPAAVRGSCGDYVHAGGLSQAGPGKEARSTLPGPAPRRHQVPCNGPGCSNHPRQPLPSTVPQVVTGQEHWASPMAVPHPEPPAPAFAPVDHNVQPSREHRSGIYHPPRCLVY